MFGTKFCENRCRLLNFRRMWIFYYRAIKFKKLNLSTQLPVWRSQNQVTYFLKKKNLVKSVRKQYGNLDSHSFFIKAYENHFHTNYLFLLWKDKIRNYSFHICVSNVSSFFLILQNTIFYYVWSNFLIFFINNILINNWKVN